VVNGDGGDTLGKAGPESHEFFLGQSRGAGLERMLRREARQTDRQRQQRVRPHAEGAGGTGNRSIYIGAGGWWPTNNVTQISTIIVDRPAYASIADYLSAPDFLAILTPSIACFGLTLMPAWFISPQSVQNVREKARKVRIKLWLKRESEEAARGCLYLIRHLHALLGQVRLPLRRLELLPGLGATQHCKHKHSLRTDP
jgi:hypothetical protein